MAWTKLSRNYHSSSFSSIQEIFRGASQVGCWWDRLPLGGQGDELLLLRTMIVTTKMVTMLIKTYSISKIVEKLNKLSSIVNTKHLHRWKTKNRSQRQESSFRGRSSDMSRNSLRGLFINIVHQMFQMFIQVPISAVCEELPLRDSIPISGRGISQHLHWPDWTLL